MPARSAPPQRARWRPRSRPRPTTGTTILRDSMQRDTRWPKPSTAPRDSTGRFLVDRDDDRVGVQDGGVGLERRGGGRGFDAAVEGEGGAVARALEVHRG